MGLLFEKEYSEQELKDWWDAEFDSIKFVGSSNHGERVEYKPRSKEVIEKNISYIMDVLRRQGRSDT